MKSLKTKKDKTPRDPKLAMMMPKGRVETVTGRVGN
jgi:hypothetical protein